MKSKALLHVSAMFLLLILSGCGVGAKKKMTSDIPAVAITFDYWPDAYNVAYPIMYSEGVVGTYFVDYRTVDNVTKDNAYNIGLTRYMLTQMKSSGWTIGAYSGDNMVDKLKHGRSEANDFLKTIKSEMRSFGFDVLSLAPNQRAWNMQLRDLSEPLFRRVRAAPEDFSKFQPLPVRDPLFIDAGGSPSLSSSDTAASLESELETFLRQSRPGLWSIVIHKVGDAATDPSGMTIDVKQFSMFISYLKRQADMGRVQIIGYDDIPS
ncbi:hypothetical protein [Pandoraea sp. CB10b_02]|uniref:hypothetical protein n=1 Tax=Pandoraea sp. CB10b_02 TaxID=2014535 RepID=UPI00257F8740|nr:hypothetical protein [Pandoraea sp. CB10b_02]